MFAQVTVEFGGSDDVRMLLLRLRCLSDSTALLVTDPKGHIQFATSQMAVLVGYSVKVMMDGMNMAGLLPPPYSQLHAAFMKVRCQQGLPAAPACVQPGRCRGGRVLPTGVVARVLCLVCRTRAASCPSAAAGPVRWFT